MTVASGLPNSDSPILQQSARAVVQEVDADLLQNREGGPVDGFEFVLGDEIERRERRLRLDRRLCGEGRRRALGAAPAPASGVLRLGFSGHGFLWIVALKEAARRARASRENGIATYQFPTVRLFRCAQLRRLRRGGLALGCATGGEAGDEP